ncbi:unnamed protein product [Polarella glacialis]|uniref:Uncharacterized protein n=1 Tax=Polarella glacialis TaxID=89957 RepID=A0A813KXQ6_POLGL|nr:unnamed protein product [Polarella glacialis]
MCSAPERQKVRPYIAYSILVVTQVASALGCSVASAEVGADGHCSAAALGGALLQTAASSGVVKLGGSFQGDHWHSKQPALSNQTEGSQASDLGTKTPDETVLIKLQEQLKLVKLQPDRSFHAVSKLALAFLTLSLVAVLASYCLNRMLAKPRPRPTLQAAVQAVISARRLGDTTFGKAPRAAMHPAQRLERIPVDIYGAAVSSCIRDIQVLMRGDHENATSIRAARVVASICGVWLHLGLQSYVSYMVAWTSSSVMVREFREQYNSFELHMYTSGSTDVPATVVGMDHALRGIDKYWHPENFLVLTEEARASMCQMPFAHDFFFLVIILIWTLSIVVDLRKCLQMFHAFVVTMPRAPSLIDSCELERQRRDDPTVAIVGVPLAMKVFLTAAVFIPRAAIDCWILWLGCLWLAATSSLGDLVMNTVALEFVVLLNSLVLFALVPKHGLDGLERTKVLVASSRHSSAGQALISTLAWAVFCFCWCTSFVYYLQSVLPDYKWDVQDVCNVWESAMTAQEATGSTILPAAGQEGGVSGAASGMGRILLALGLA